MQVIFQVRRTRISERMRKLQELVPNMDKVRHIKARLIVEYVNYMSHAM